MCTIFVPNLLSFRAMLAEILLVPVVCHLIVEDMDNGVITAGFKFFSLAAAEEFVDKCNSKGIKFYVCFDWW